MIILRGFCGLSIVDGDVCADLSEARS